MIGSAPCKFDLRGEKGYPFVVVYVGMLFDMFRDDHLMLRHFMWDAELLMDQYIINYRSQVSWRFFTSDVVVSFPAGIVIIWGKMG